MKNEIKYNQLVAEGKRIVESMKNNKLKLTQLALEVCDIIPNAGGNDHYTVKKFSQDIGFEKYETLRSWVKNYRKIVNKVPKKMIVQNRPEALFRAAKNLNLNTPAKTVIQAYKKELNKTKEDTTLDAYLSYSKSMDFFINHSVVLSALNQGDLKLLKTYIDSISKKLDNHFKPKTLLKKSTSLTKMVK